MYDLLPRAIVRLSLIVFTLYRIKSPGSIDLNPDLMIASNPITNSQTNSLFIGVARLDRDLDLPVRTDLSQHPTPNSQSNPMFFRRDRRQNLAALPAPLWLVGWGKTTAVRSWLPHPFAQRPPSGIDLSIQYCQPPHWCDMLGIESPWCRENFGIAAASEGCWAISPDRRYIIAGDVWCSNRRELIGKLSLTEAPSDIELMARLWERYRFETPNLIYGMFSCVVCDLVEERIAIVRDPIGARTVYHTTAGETIWIAPQLSGLNPYRSNDLDPIALRDYLTCAFVPGERTLWQDVRELRPGTILNLPTWETHTYWELQERSVEAAPLEWHGERLRAQLETIVREYLPVNAPVGVFLSGGLDSSCITALAARLHPAPVHTYSIHFGAECPNELEFSSLVAAHCQTEHHILEITFADMWARLPETMAQLDDPIGDPLTVPNLLVGRSASRDVSITLNGEGGDPCFGGPKNQPMLIDSLYNLAVDSDCLQAYLLSFQKCAADLPQLLKPEFASQIDRPWVFTADLNSELNFLNRLMAINIKYKGADQILTKVNNLTRAAGLQGRSPLFDRRIVEMSMAIPPAYKLSGTIEKAVLKQAVADLLPATIIDRPKSGMMVPVQRGFRQYWQRQARQLLLDRQAEISRYLDRHLINEWLNFRGDVWGRYGVKLWLLVSLEMWLRVNRRDRFS